MTEKALFVTGCETCGHIIVVGEDCETCRIRRTHDENCAYSRAATAAVALECGHGFDVCPACDPCHCGPGGEARP